MKTQAKIFRLADQISNLCKSEPRLKAGIEFAKDYTVVVAVLVYGNFFCGFRSKNVVKFLSFWWKSRAKILMITLKSQVWRYTVALLLVYANFFCGVFVQNVVKIILMKVEIFRFKLQIWKAGIEFAKDTLLRLVFSPNPKLFFCGFRSKMVKFPAFWRCLKSFAKSSFYGGRSFDWLWSNLKSLQNLSFCFPKARKFAKDTLLRLLFSPMVTFFASFVQKNVVKFPHHFDENSRRSFDWLIKSSLQKWARLKAGIEFAKDTLLRLPVSPMVTFFCVGFVQKCGEISYHLDETQVKNLIGWSDLPARSRSEPASSYTNTLCRFS